MIEDMNYITGKLIPKKFVIDQMRTYLSRAGYKDGNAVFHADHVPNVIFNDDEILNFLKSYWSLG